mmetsp:Transcript_17357/g.52342  ORF Transcript_17357/g.52342 Transcript_17357/m.52342 type:complete len:260 (-) Transcript_17357:124-903(-)
MKLPVHTVVVHLLAPEVNSTLWHFVIKVPILDKNLALDVVVVRSKINLLGKLFRGKTRTRIIRIVQPDRQGLQQPVETHDCLQRMAGPHLLQDALAAEAVADRAGEPRLDRRVSICCLQVSSHETAPVLRVAQHDIHRGEGTLEVANCRIPLLGGVLLRLEARHDIATWIPVLEGVLGHLLVVVDGEADVTHPSKECRLIYVELLQAGIVVVNEHHWCRWPAPDVGDVAVRVGVAVVGHWESLHDQIAIFSRTRRCPRL